MIKNGPHVNAAKEKNVQKEAEAEPEPESAPMQVDEQTEDVSY